MTIEQLIKILRPSFIQMFPGVCYLVTSFDIESANISGPLGIDCLLSHEISLHPQETLQFQYNLFSFGKGIDIFFKDCA